VTGSKFLVQADNTAIMVDAGLFQGGFEWRERNWHDFPSYSGMALTNLDAVLLTHAHIDHTGLLPRLSQKGLKSPVFCTEATQDLLKLLLPDSGRLNQEESTFRGKHGYSRYKDPQPLYTELDAIEALKLLKAVPFENRCKIANSAYATWYRTGHILGAGAINVELGDQTLTFSGDLGRYNMPILRDPQPLPLGETLIIESTYGNRDHVKGDILTQLAEVISTTTERGGVIIIPSFAVGRAQLLLYYLRELKEQQRIPNIPVFVDSPMATDATAIYARHPKSYDEEALQIQSSGHQPFSLPKLHYIQSAAESKQLNSITKPMIIIAASGMLTGGRVLHHVFHRISSPLNAVLFTGYQASGSTGGVLQSRPKIIRIFKQDLPVRAQIATLSGLSAHGDRNELIRWLTESIKQYNKTPRRIIVVHGEQEATQDFANLLQTTFSVPTQIPHYQETIELD
ncbi:MAG: MBL fold metallo-hydrolase, partial [Bacteroidales bacterium]|nr:MBL fold metallo-hydrolase [Bacteroidales bacterium]